MSKHLRPKNLIPGELYSFTLHKKSDKLADIMSFVQYDDSYRGNGYGICVRISLNRPMLYLEQISDTERQVHLWMTTCTHTGNAMLVACSDYTLEEFLITHCK